jgi:hypothetical protein
MKNKLATNTKVGRCPTGNFNRISNFNYCFPFILIENLTNLYLKENWACG